MQSSNIGSRQRLALNPVRRFLDLTERALDVLASWLVGVCLAAISIQVVMRYVFNDATTWSDTVAASALFAVLALRATGIGFIMITLALGQIVWGIAYRWVGLTNGDNGVNLKTRPAPFGLSLASPEAFYWATFVIFLVAMATMYLFVRSPFGATVRGTRDQPRRMNALGFNVWLIRFLAFLFSGFWCGVGGLLYVYYNQFVSPQVAALQTSAEVLLMVISGGTATLFGPIAGAAIVVIMKNVVSAWIERWNLVLGIVFVLIISFMPEGLVPGAARLWRLARQWLGGNPGASQAVMAEPAQATERVP